MERNFDLIRRILRDVEKMPPGGAVEDSTYHGEYDRATVCEHMRLLIEEDFIEGNVQSDRGRVTAVIIFRLLWKGHDFIKAAQDDSLWNKAKTTILKPTTSFTFDLLLEWLKAEAKSKFGLP
jgi:hypothetical protein